MLYASLATCVAILTGVNGLGSFQVPPNELYQDVPEGPWYPSIEQGTPLGCGQPGEVEGNNDNEFRHHYKLDFTGGAADIVTMSTCNHSDFDTGLSIWEWDPTEPFDTYEMRLVTSSDDVPGCLGASTLVLNAANEIHPNFCYFVVVGNGDTGLPAATGNYDLKMNCGSGSNLFPQTCDTPSPTPSPTQSPTAEPTTRSPTTLPPTTPHPVVSTPIPTPSPTTTHCCLTRRLGRQSDCEAVYEDQGGCGLLADKNWCFWWASTELCNACCQPRRPQNQRKITRCLSKNDNQGACESDDSCVWSGVVPGC